MTMNRHFSCDLAARRTVLVGGGLGLATLLIPSVHASEPAESCTGDEFPHMHRPTIRNFVGACHRNIDTVSEMLKKRPGLVHATWDWGFGDFETGLGAASHTGRREIAELLIAAGARVDIFAAAMLGWTDVVRSMITADPRVKSTLGPHAIPLLAHARIGGDAAAGTLAMLQEMGGADQSPTLTADLPSEKASSACVGRYRITSIDTTIEVRKNNKELLECALPSGGSVLLYLINEREFFPSGVPSVTFQFDPRGERSATLTIRTGETTFEGVRVD